MGVANGMMLVMIRGAQTRGMVMAGAEEVRALPGGAPTVATVTGMSTARLDQSRGSGHLLQIITPMFGRKKTKA